MNTQRSLPQIGEKVRLFIYLSVHEDALDLSEFYTMTELNCFKMLTSVSGVGAKVGVSILLELSPEQVTLVVVSGGSEALSRASGVGLELAQRITPELKDKVKKMGVVTVSTGGTAMNPAIGNTAGAVSTLAVLDRSSMEVVRIVDRFDSSPPMEELIRLSLKSMGGGRQDMELFLENELDLENRVATPDYSPEDAKVEDPLCPHQLSGYTDQQRIRENLVVFMETARQGKETLDHVLLYGPSGLGKITLVGIIANKMGMGVCITSGSVIGGLGNLVAILANLFPGDVLFTDEVHRLSYGVEEILYSAMGDLALDIIAGKGQVVTSYHLSLPSLTLVGVITRAGQLSASLCDRFDVVLRLKLYSSEELAQIVTRSAGILDIPVGPEGALELASRSRGASRIANRLLRRVRSFAQVVSDGVITVQAARRVFERFKVDEIGLDVNDRHMLRTMIEYCRGGPVGLDMLAAAIGEEFVTLEDVYEPCLIQIGFLSRTPHGCCVTRSAYSYLSLAPPEGLTGAQQKLF